MARSFGQQTTYAAAAVSDVIALNDVIAEDASTLVRAAAGSATADVSGRPSGC